jgi:hypothetical protein
MIEKVGKKSSRYLSDPPPTSIAPNKAVVVSPVMIICRTSLRGPLAPVMVAVPEVATLACPPVDTHLHVVGSSNPIAMPAQAWHGKGLKEVPVTRSALSKVVGKVP